MSVMDFALWYSGRAKLCWREAEAYFKQFRYPECAQSFTDSVEFATKAICEFLSEKYDPRHDVSDALIRASGRLHDYRGQLSRAAWISSRWVGMAQRARLLVRYGNQKAKVHPAQIVTQRDIAPLRADALEICKFLISVEIKAKFQPPIRMGILDGRVDESDTSERPCIEYGFTEFRIDDWEKRFSQIDEQANDKYSIERIPISRVGNQFSLIINPFGELYPEKDPRRRLAFNILRNYVADGGVLVNIAGFPFFWAWDVVEGEKEPVVDTAILVPEVEVVENKMVVDRFLPILSFAGSLLWREFGVMTTSDTPKLSGVNELETYQDEEDKIIAGDLADVGGSTEIHEFRALRKGEKEFMPLLRTCRPDFGEVYPIAAIPHAWGCLIVAGMHTRGTAEFEKLATAVDNFCSWMRRNLHGGY